MWRTTIAGLRAHTRRMFGTALAVIFGVGFVVGTLVFTDTARAGFYDTYARTAQGIDVAVEPTKSTLLSQGQVDAVRALPDVRAVDARIVASLALLDKRGRPITNFGQVGTVVSTDGDPTLRAFDVTGRVPSAPGEAVLDKETAAHQRFSVGDAVTVLDRSGAKHRYTLVGLIDFGTSKRFSGQSVVGLPAPDITALTGQTGYDEIVASSRDGSAVVAKVRAAVGTGPVVKSGDQRRTDLANSATNVADQFRFILLIFGAIALIVATFVIYNTFAILLAQRVRETALLRCVGATRRQVFGSVLLESVLVGLAGGVAGIVLGIGISYGLLGLLNGVLHAGVPVHTVVVRATPVVVGLAIALVVTVAAAFIPAVRATRTAPLAALRDGAGARTGSRAGRVVRIVLAAIVGAVGVALTVAGSNNSKDFQAGTFAIVGGGVIAFVAVLILAPVFVGPLTTLLGALPAKLFGPPARLATANARRNPGRTAVTTATLMIGIGLMALFSVLITSIKATATAQLVGHYPVDYVMNGVSFGKDQAATIPAGYAQALRARQEFSSVVETRSVDTGHYLVGAIDPASLGTTITPQLTTGRLADFRQGTAIVLSTRSLAKATSITVTVNGKSATFRVVGSTSSSMPGGDPVEALLTWNDLAALAGPGGDTTVMVKDAPGVTPVQSRDALDGLADAYPQVEVNSLADLSSDLENAVNGLIALFGGLLGTAVLIALFGIANTLSLSVVERTRESATVRALGLTKGQLRATLLVEALLMGVVGAVVGVAFGLVYGRLVVAEAFQQVRPILVTPWSWLAAMVVLAAVAGMVAAVLPARRAARASIVAAMAET
jgi:putative ABC transport system permease protein